MLRAVLLGTPQVDLQGIPLSHRLVGKELALFAYLAFQGDLCPRTKLLDLLWTDANEQKARENLRSLLYSLRQTIGDYLTITRQAVGLNRQLPYWFDVEVFRNLPMQMGSQDPRFLTEVLSLYTEDLLNGFSISGASMFDAWLADQREQLRTQAASGWQQLVRFHTERKQFDDALTANRRLLALAPWSEEAHQQQMQLLVATGQRSAALIHYELCRRRLQDELDVPPSSETVNIYMSIRAQGEVISTLPLPTDLQEANTIAVPLSMPGGSPPMHFENVVNHHTTEYRGAMVAPLTTWGRQYEIAQLRQWVQVERCRCVAVVGLAGEGKSTLVHEVIQFSTPGNATAPAFEGAIVFSCHNRLPIDSLLQEWLYQLSGRQLVTLPPTLDRQMDLLAEYLQQRAFLLVLDDFDHCFVEDGWASSAERAAFLQIWRLFIDRPHRCTLLLTARRLPLLHGLAESPGRFRQISLSGLEVEAGHQLLKSYGLEGTTADFTALHHAYSGNPLMLRLAAQTIDHLFNGSIAAFLQEQALFIGEIGELLKQQLSILAPLERSLLTWLALASKPLSSQQLWRLLAPPPAKHVYFTALQNLSRASLLEVHDGHLHIHSLIREYIACQLTDQLFDEVYESLMTLRLIGGTLHTYALCIDATKMQAEGAYSSCLQVHTLLERLQRCLGREHLAATLQQLLAQVDANQAGITLSDHSAGGNRSYAHDNLTYLLACVSRR